MSPHSHSPSDRPDAEQRVDAALRRALEPDRATVQRVLRGALAETPPEAVPVRPWRLAVAAAALLALAAVSLTLFDSRDPDRPPVAPPATAAARPAALKIANPNGMVTVTTQAGSQLVLLPIVPQPGDAS